MSVHVVTGGAGFLGSNLCRALLKADQDVVCVDNLVTGSLKNIRDLIPRKRHFALIVGDAADRDVLDEAAEEHGDVERVWALAALASPVAYFNRPLETAWAGADALRKTLEFARDWGARLLYSSTSEVYGDPLVHPQPETYWGNVNPLGLRSCYDESKRYGEALAMIFSRQFGLDVRIARIFNTYGPGMAAADGRMIPAFLGAAHAGDPLPVHGDGSQTRSLCYVDDLIRGLMALMAADEAAFSGIDSVVNLGNPVETTVKDVAFECWRTVRPGDAYKVNTTVGHPDDPKRRCPDITRARELLDWAPQVTLEQGLRQTAAWLFGDDRGRSKTGGDPEAGERLGEGVQASGSQDGARSTG